MEHQDVILDLLNQYLPGFRATDPPQPLSGGLMNYVWRISGSTPTGQSSLIVKWSPPFIASLPEVALDPARSAFEARALNALQPEGVLSSVAGENMRTPHLYLFVEEQHFLVMEDVGNGPDLAAWLRAESRSTVEADRMGRSLGQFIGGLHRASATQPELARSFDNHSIQLTRLNFQYKNIAQYAQNAELPNACELGRIAVEYGEKLQQPGKALIMGDLWPPSILVTNAGLRIIDWELAHYGFPSQDIGHLAAHLWMQAHRALNPQTAVIARQILSSFLRTYRVALGAKFDALMGAEGLRESSIHFGSEILTRAAGAFQKGFLYDGLSQDSPILQEAVQVAAQHLLTPTTVDTWDAFKASAHPE
jgi:aminoglycoside phosphotransferase (APT) family kinase protein